MVKGSVLEPSGTGSTGHRENFWQLLIEASAVVPQLTTPSYANPTRFIKLSLILFFKIKCCLLISLNICLKNNNACNLKLFYYVERLFPPSHSHYTLKNNTLGNVPRIVCGFFLLSIKYPLRYLLYCMPSMPDKFDCTTITSAVNLS